MRLSLVTILVGLCLGAGVTSEARAADCGDIEAEGACEDVTTLVWCDGGDLRRVTCPGHEICVRHELFGGAPGCIAPGQTDCGEDITPAGQCTPSNSVVWCAEDGVPHHESCAEGTLCSWDEDNEWFDCLNDTGGGRRDRPTDEPDAQGSEDTESDSSASVRPPDAVGPSDDAETAGPMGPTPVLEFGAEPGTVTGGGSACSGGHPVETLGWLVVIAALALLRGRRRSRVVARSL